LKFHPLASCADAWHIAMMAANRLKRPRDPVQLGKMIGDILTGQVEDRSAARPEDDAKDKAAVALGRKGGLKGGKARAAKMTPERRAEIARKAAKTRWGGGGTQ
jgi:hypothetical protein